jgi:hypothetical protein
MELTMFIAPLVTTTAFALFMGIGTAVAIKRDRKRQGQ